MRIPRPSSSAFVPDPVGVIAIVEDPTTSPLGPTEMGVPDTVVAGPSASSVVPEMVKPFSVEKRANT